jgi:hypothetical protein
MSAQPATNVCSDCWFHDCKNCRGTAPDGSPCLHLSAGHHDEHVCERDGAPLSTDWWSCVDGTLYGPCEDVDCGGVCELAGDCLCPCHRAAS